SIDWIDGDVELWRAGNPCPKLLAFENSRGFVLHSFADHDFAADVHQVEHSAHRVACGSIGCFLVAPTEPAQRIERRSFCRAKKKLESVAEIVSLIAIEAVGTVVDGELRAQSYVETVAMRQIAYVTDRVAAHRKNVRFIRRFKDEFMSGFFHAFPTQINGVASALII